jgi:PIN domain nuclease of toxin-antitoxin system
LSLLLDTNVLIWLLTKDRRVPPDTLALLADPANLLYASAASVWEIAIKVGLGKLDLPRNVATWLPRELYESGMTPLPITADHAARVETLPPHHRDPFDRLLIAQALAENLTIVTADARFAAYGVRLLAL